jgi:hypothetical protein
MNKTHHGQHVASLLHNEQGCMYQKETRGSERHFAQLLTNHCSNYNATLKLHYCSGDVQLPTIPCCTFFDCKEQRLMNRVSGGGGDF